MKEFRFVSRYGVYENCYFRVGRYENNNLAIEIWNNEDGPITRVTVNPDIKLPDDRIAVKDYSENEGMVAWLISMGIIESDIVQIIESGRVEIPVSRLTPHGIEMLELK